MDGNGFDIVDRNKGVYFDFDKDGIREKASWVSKQDGFLVSDFNNDGVINNSGEFFGDMTVLQNNILSQSGIQSLEYFDKNKDKTIDSADEIYSKLRVWQDLNQNGISESGELKTLKELDIKSIDFKTVENKNEAIQSSTLTRTIEYTRNNGERGKMGEFLLSRDSFDSYDEDIQNLTEDIKILPNVRAIGKSRTLHNEMYLDKTGKIKELVKKFIVTYDNKKRNEILDEILIKIAKTQDVDKNSRGQYGDARIFDAVEYFYNFKPYIKVLEKTKSGDYDFAYKEIRKIYYEELILQTTLKDIYMLFEVQGGKVKDIDLLNKYLEYKMKKEPQKAEILLSDTTRILKSMSDKNIQGLEEFKKYFIDKSITYKKIIYQSISQDVYGTDGKDNLSALEYTKSNAFYAGSGDDIVRATNQDDIIFGQEGNDKIFAGFGDDIIDAGQGYDFIEGSYGSDTYLFGRGDGVDTIRDVDSNYYSNIYQEQAMKEDILQFKEGIKFDDLEFVRRSSRDGEIRIKDTNDKVIIKDLFVKIWGIEKIKFEDGSTYLIEDLRDKFSVVNGDDTNNNLSPYDNEIGHTIYGRGGDDTIRGSIKDDIIEGGKNNDFLIGGFGSDTYIFSKDDGVDIISDHDTTADNKDKIILEYDVLKTMLKKEGNNLTIGFAGSTDKISISNWNGGKAYQIEEIYTSDNKMITNNQVDQLI